ncbi:MAG TPA: tetratricopeptide repeat protein [Polyangiaceae bacterium]|jgi:tetratricopeptide (TPR) repeat protein
MRRLLLALSLAATTTWAFGSGAQPRPPAAPPAPPPPPAAAPVPAPLAAPATGDKLFADALRAYHTALLSRRLGQQDLRKEDVALRVAEGEQLMASGRVDEAIARLGELVEHPQFDLYIDTEDGRAATFRLGDALATAGLYTPARGYLRRVVEARGAWDGNATWARRAVRRLVDVALESEEYAIVFQDLAGVPASAPAEVRGEIAYMNGRAQEAAGNPDAAISVYATVPQVCRFWAQATYLAALIDVEKGNYKDGENLLCKVADPKRSASTTPVFADEKFFAVRDLARLGLGRIAHEQGRNDDARYYYYLVPRDSDRLAEALYEAATTRYEKKDYDGARELLDELAGLGVHHRYQDEAWVLDAWVDLARCRFADADKKLVTFLERYEPVRDAARRIAQNDVAMQRMLAAVRSGSDAGGAEIGGTSPEVIRTIAALVRIDTAYDRVQRRRSVLEREASGLVNAVGAIGDMQRTLSTNGGVRPSAELGSDDVHKARDARDAIDGVEHQLADLESARAPAAQIAPLRQQLSELKARLAQGGGANASGSAGELPSGADLPDLLRADATRGVELQARIATVRRRLDDAETALAKDALRRLDLRLSRLLRRARLGRIESVLGRKRALEVEVEAIRLGYLPQDAVDSLDAARFLEDNEEYWPFEGDDWPDEYVGGEIK